MFFFQMEILPWATILRHFAHLSHMAHSKYYLLLLLSAGMKNEMKKQSEKCW